LLTGNGRERSTDEEIGLGLMTYDGLKTATAEIMIVTEIVFVLVVMLTETVAIGVVIEIG